MDEVIVWIIIIGFYAPLHYLVPVLVLFITGQESEQTRRRLIRNSLVDSTLSMVAAFAIVITLTYSGQMLVAMLILLLSMGAPFVRIWLHRREITAEPNASRCQAGSSPPSDRIASQRCRTKPAPRPGRRDRVPGTATTVPSRQTRPPGPV